MPHTPHLPLIGPLIIFVEAYKFLHNLLHKVIYSGVNIVSNCSWRISGIMEEARSRGISVRVETRLRARRPESESRRVCVCVCGGGGGGGG
jgi:hypothetical protein